MLMQYGDLFLEKCRDSTIATFIMMKLYHDWDIFWTMRCTVDCVSVALMVGFLVGIFCCGVRILQFYYWDKSLMHDVFMLGVLTVMADMIIHINHYGNIFWIEPVLTGTLAAIIFYAITHIKRKI